MSIELTQFARIRLFPCSGRRNAIDGCSPKAFQQHLNEVTPVKVLEGYAPFCQLRVYRNWTRTRCTTVAITPDNAQLLKSAYEARTRDELPVLNRWFEGVSPPLASYLIVIVYDREQLQKEGESIAAEWGIVGCMATDLPEEVPMAPITMMRNALGVDEGGSGVPLDRDAYRRSVEFWSTHANWREAPP
ncbi:DUF3228 family protein [Banduia mediterranea]|uniref:DUF3228 family protein n=1 Tax=Banduia mediterranea TaxID=3075609 RepID=UPI0032C2143B